jgi:predicted RNase H-like HicB family nuclease
LALARSDYFGPGLARKRPGHNLEWEPDRSAVTATFDDLPGATFGATQGEALASAEDLLETSLSFYTDDGVPAPRPAPAKGRPVYIRARWSPPR